MDTRQIKILLEKYFEGQTTLQEELVLRDYFLTEVTPPEFLQYKNQFLLIRAGQEYEPAESGDFETRLTEMIDSRHEIPLKEISSGSFLRIAAAAAIVALIGISGFLIIQSRQHNNRDTFSDPQQAYAEAQKTILYVAQSMNTGIEPLSEVAKINAGSEHLKSLKKLNSSLDMLKVVSFINKSSNLKK